MFCKKEIPICVLQKTRISMLTLQTVNGISGIQKDKPGYKNSICKFHFIYLQILRTLWNSNDIFGLFALIS